MYIVTQEDYDLIQMKNQKTFLKINILDYDFKVVDSIESEVFEGSVEIDAESDIRRTCSVSVIVRDDKYKITSGGRIWLDKYIQLYRGVENPRTKEIRYWNLGIFLINQPSRQYDSATNTLSFTGVDMMAKLTGLRNGQLERVILEIYNEDPVSEAIKNTLTQLGKIKKYAISEYGYVMPEDISMGAGYTVYDILARIRDLFPSTQIYFDINGIFIFNKVPDGRYEPVMLDFNQMSTNIIISATVDTDFEKVKNVIHIVGYMPPEEGEEDQIEYILKDENPESPFFVGGTVGEIYHIVEDERITNMDLAIERAEYELYLGTSLQDTISLEIVPVPWLDVNCKIHYKNDGIGIDGDYLIKSLSIPLGIDGTMSLSAIKIYYNKDLD